MEASRKHQRDGGASDRGGFDRCHFERQSAIIWRLSRDGEAAEHSENDDNRQHPAVYAAPPHREHDTNPIVRQAREIRDLRNGLLSASAIGCGPCKDRTSKFCQALTSL